MHAEEVVSFRSIAGTSLVDVLSLQRITPSYDIVV